MFNFKKNNMDNDLTRLNQQISQVIHQIDSNSSEDPNILVRSEKEELQEIATSINTLIAAYEKKYEDLAVKHEIVTRLNQIGTWDGPITDGNIDPNEYNEYNETFRKELGYEDENDFPSVLSSWYNTVSEDDLEMVNDAYGALFYEDTPYDIEYRSKNKDESFEWVHVRAEVLRNEAGEVIRHIGTLRNIHDEKINEMKIEQLLERLELIETALKMSTHNVEGAWGMNFQKTEDDPEKYWFSPQFITLLGCETEADFTPSVDTWLNLITDPSIKQEFTDFLYSDDKMFSKEFRMQTITGEEKWFRMTLNIDRDYQGQPTILSGVLRDIQEDVDRLAEASNIGEEMKDFTVALENLATQVQNISNEAGEIAAVNTQTVKTSKTATEKLEDTIKVTDLIKDISDKTNLLGINASIEASLSGEEGNGFQVIAREIVKLSTETNNAVDQVEEILEEVSEAVLDIVESIGNITEKIDNQATYSKESNDATIVINDKASTLLNSMENLR